MKSITSDHKENNQYRHKWRAIKLCEHNCEGFLLSSISFCNVHFSVILQQWLLLHLMETTVFFCLFQTNCCLFCSCCWKSKRHPSCSREDFSSERPSSRRSRIWRYDAIKLDVLLELQWLVEWSINQSTGSQVIIQAKIQNNPWSQLLWIFGAFLCLLW